MAVTPELKNETNWLYSLKSAIHFALKTYLYLGYYYLSQ
jgi:hypothetical protein